MQQVLTPSGYVDAVTDFLIISDESGHTVHMSCNDEIICTRGPFESRDDASAERDAMGRDTDALLAAAGLVK